MGEIKRKSQQSVSSDRLGDEIDVIFVVMDVIENIDMQMPCFLFQDNVRTFHVFGIFTRQTADLTAAFLARATEVNC